MGGGRVIGTPKWGGGKKGLGGGESTPPLQAPKMGCMRGGCIFRAQRNAARFAGLLARCMGWHKKQVAAACWAKETSSGCPLHSLAEQPPGGQHTCCTASPSLDPFLNIWAAGE